MVRTRVRGIESGLRGYFSLIAGSVVLEPKPKPIG